MKDSGTFVKTLLPADANTIVTLLDFNVVLAPYQQFEQDWIVSHAIVLEDFQAKVGLFSLSEAPWLNTNVLASESAVEAALAKIKKEGQKVYLDLFHAYGNGPWEQKGEEILQNKNSLEQPWGLMAPYFSTNETGLLDEDLKIGVRIGSRAQGVGGLKGEDYIRLFGSWRKVTTFRKKKDDENEIEALEARIISVNVETNTSIELVPARTNKSRRGIMIYNRGPGVAFISYGPSVSFNVYSVKLESDDYFEDSTTRLYWQGSYWAMGSTETILNVTELLS